MQHAAFESCDSTGLFEEGKVCFAQAVRENEK